MTTSSHLGPDSTKLPKTEPATERKRAEIALEQERTKLRTLFRTIPDVIWAKDKEGKYLGCNPAFERLCGMSEADIIGKTDEDMGELERLSFFSETDRITALSGTPVIRDEWLIFADYRLKSWTSSLPGSSITFSDADHRLENA